MILTDNKPAVAMESGHFYRRDGSPCYEVPNKSKGGMRPTTLKDCKALDLVPSVTTITKLLSSPGLTRYFQWQMFEAAITTPRLKEDTDDQHFARCLEWAKEHAMIAARRGTELHGAIERALQGRPDAEWDGHTQAVFAALKAAGIDYQMGTAERSFAHTDGFGGRVDLSAQAFVLDFKSKKTIEEGKRLAWDEHILQLSAYRHGLCLPEHARLINVFVGVDDQKVSLHEWSKDEAAKALRKFRLLLAYWQEANL